jgi:hypothetical protein
MQTTALHIIWLLLAAVNFSVQLAYFRRDRSAILFFAKKLTTPLLLLFGLVIVVVHRGAFPLIPGVILAAMGIGEIGIEGSSVVEASDSGDSLTVTLAGLLFLLVNLFIGAWLMAESGRPTVIAAAMPAALLIIGLKVLYLLRHFRPGKETRFQILLYSFSLFVLLSGTLTSLFGGLSILGAAAGILTISDTLVLTRMAAGFDKETASGRRILLGLLIVILLLYYLFIGLLIHLGAPFAI